MVGDYFEESMLGKQPSQAASNKAFNSYLRSLESLATTIKPIANEMAFYLKKKKKEIKIATSTQHH